MIANPKNTNKPTNTSVYCLRIAILFLRVFYSGNMQRNWEKHNRRYGLGGY